MLVHQVITDNRLNPKAKAFIQNKIEDSLNIGSPKPPS